MNKEVTQILNTMAKIKANVEDPALKATLLAQEEQKLKVATGYQTAQGSLGLEVTPPGPPTPAGKSKTA